MSFSSRWSPPPKLCPTWRPQFPRDPKFSRGLRLFFVAFPPNPTGFITHWENLGKISAVFVEPRKAK